MIGIVLFVVLALVCLVVSRHAAFLIFTAGMILFSRAFSHISVGLYVTEYFMVLVLVSFLLVFFLKGSIRIVHIPFEKTLAILFVIMMFDLARGVLVYPDKSFVVRQSAIFYYALFYFLVPHICTSLDKIEHYFKVFFLMAVVVSLVGIFDIQWYTIGKFGYYYESLAFIFVAIAIVNQKAILHINTRQWGALILLSAVVLSSVRAAWMGIFIVVVFLYFSSYFGRYFNKMTEKIRLYGSIVFLVLLIFIGIFKFSLFESLAGKMLSILPGSRVVSVSSNNTKWRLIVWKDTLSEAVEKPLLGWGFGKKFIPPTIKKMGWGGSWRESEGGFQDPHNSFISIFYRTGFIGLIVFCGLLGSFIVRTMCVIRRLDDSVIKTYMTGLLLCIICILGTSCFMVVLEGPFLGIFLWIAMGLIVSLERIDIKTRQTLLGI
ncbi:MAG: O-antigen ligase family protein [Elusimicrobia bacterium]|nr:O-antigen ligase family protein [Elusimicrobiota bacterium]